MLFIFTPEKIKFHIGLWLSMLYARYHLRAIGFQPEDNYILGFGYPSLMQDPSSFGLLAFAPKRHSIWGFGNQCFMQDPPSDYWSSPRRKTRLYMEMTMPWSYGILLGLRILAFLTRVHRSVYPSSSSKKGSHRRIASECHLEK